MAHLHLDLRRDRDLASAVLDELPFLVAEVAAVDVRRVGTEQPVVVERLDHREPSGEPAHRDVHGDRDAQLARELPLRSNNLLQAEAGAASGQAHGEQTVVGAEVGVADASYVVAGNRDLAVEPVVGQREVGAAVGVLRPDAGLLQRGDSRIRVIGGVVDVRPVDQRGDPGIEALQRPGDVARMNVLGSVDRREGVQDLDEVVIERGVGRAAPDRGLPGMPVGVDKARDHDAVARVDHLGVGADIRLDGDDLVVLDEHVAGELPDLGVHAYDGRSADERLGCHLPLLLCIWLVSLVPL